MSDKQPLRNVDREKWQDWDDREYSRKKIGTWIVELVGGHERGGNILIWEKTEMGYKNNVGDLAWEIEHQDNLGYFSEKYCTIKIDGRPYRLFDELSFMYFENAKPAYDDIETEKDIIDLAWRDL